MSERYKAWLERACWICLAVARGAIPAESAAAEEVAPFVAAEAWVMRGAFSSLLLSALLVGQGNVLLLTSTGYTSPSWYEFMWPSGRRPLGKSERRTNSGRVRSSSRERVKREPLSILLAVSLISEIWINAPKI